MKNLKQKLLIITSFFVSSYASASDLYSSCDSCVSDASFEYRAEAEADKAGGFSNIVIVENPRTGKIGKYKVRQMRAEPGMPAEVFVFQLQLSDSEKNIFAQIQYSRGIVQDLFDTYNTVPDGLADSAYDLVGSSYTQNNIIDYYLQNQSLQQAIGDYTSSVIALGGKFVGINLVIELSFSDGSIALFKLTGIDSSGNITFALHSAVDQNNNDISLTKAGYQSGSFNFSENTENSINNFLEAAARAGITITTGGSGGGIGSTTMTCIKDVCTITYHPK